jgi:hypothetical protein
MTLRKCEITTARLRREWPHHVALSADKVRGLDNSAVVTRICRHAVGGAANLPHVPR